MQFIVFNFQSFMGFELDQYTGVSLKFYIVWMSELSSVHVHAEISMMFSMLSQTFSPL